VFRYRGRPRRSVGSGVSLVFPRAVRLRDFLCIGSRCANRVVMAMSERLMNSFTVGRSTPAITRRLARVCRRSCQLKSLTLFHVVCEQCNAKCKMDYVGFDPLIPLLKFTCPICCDLKTWKLDCAGGRDSAAVQKPEKWQLLSHCWHRNSSPRC